MSNHSGSQSIWPGLTSSASPGKMSTNLEPKPRHSKLETGDKTQSVVEQVSQVILMHSEV